MAESGSPSNSSVPPPSTSSSAAAPPDWEVLTMSMSASALEEPRGDSVSEESNPQMESSSNPSLTEGPFASDVWTDPRRDVPFTEGWKPPISSSSGLYGYVADKNHQEEPPLSSEGAETYFDSNASMNMPEGLIVSEKYDGGVEKRVLSHNYSMDNIKINEETGKVGIKCKGHKRPKKSSTVVWSIAVVASLVGIVFLGNRLRLACHQNEQLQIQLSAKDEEFKEMLVQVNRLKEVLGNHHRVPISKN